MMDENTHVLKTMQDELIKKIQCVDRKETFFRQDQLAMALLPSYPPLDSHIAVKTTGNGNCLFNAISLVLKGKFCSLSCDF